MSTTTTIARPRATHTLTDRELHARRGLSGDLRLESGVAPHPHTRSMVLDVLQVAAVDGWAAALDHLRAQTSSHVVITAQTAARLLSQYQASASR